MSDHAAALAYVGTHLTNFFFPPSSLRQGFCRQARAVTRMPRSSAWEFPKPREALQHTGMDVLSMPLMGRDVPSP